MYLNMLYLNLVAYFNKKSYLYILGVTVQLNSSYKKFKDVDILY